MGDDAVGVYFIERRFIFFKFNVNFLTMYKDQKKVHVHWRVLYIFFFYICIIHTYRYTCIYGDICFVKGIVIKAWTFPFSNDVCPHLTCQTSIRQTQALFSKRDRRRVRTACYVCIIPEYLSTVWHKQIPQINR